MSLFTRDGESVVCPFCGCQHGEALEWCLNDYPERMTCDGCGEEFLRWVEVTVEYVTKRPDPAAVAQLRKAIEQ